MYLPCVFYSTFVFGSFSYMHTVKKHGTNMHTAIEYPLRRNRHERAVVLDINILADRIPLAPDKVTAKVVIK